MLIHLLNHLGYALLGYCVAVLIVIALINKDAIQGYRRPILVVPGILALIFFLITV